MTVYPFNNFFTKSFIMNDNPLLARLVKVHAKAQSTGLDNVSSSDTWDKFDNYHDDPGQSGD